MTANCRDRVFCELDRHGVGQSDRGDLAEVVEELPSVAVEGAVSDLDDQATLSLSFSFASLESFEHQGNAMTARDDVRVDRPLHHRESGWTSTSQNGLPHSVSASPPQMSLTRMSSFLSSARMRSNSRATAASSV